MSKYTSSRPYFDGNHLHQPGQEFTLPAGVKPTADMSPVEAPQVPAKGAKAPQVPAKGAEAPQTLSEITKADSAAQAPRGADDLV